MASATVASLDSVLKQLYSPSEIERLTYKDNVAFLRAVPKSDAYEMRLKSYGQISTKRPGLNGRISLGPPPAVGMAAAVTLAGLGFIIARRNAVAEAEGISRPWLAAVAEWLRDVVRGLLDGSRVAGLRRPRRGQGAAEREPDVTARGLPLLGDTDHENRSASPL